MPLQSMDEWVDHSDSEEYEPYEANTQPPFFNWQELFPFLQEILDNVQHIALEAEKLEHMLRFCPWPCVALLQLRRSWR